MPLPELPDSPLGLKRAAHLLRRATFGATISQIRSFADLTPTLALQQLFVDELPFPQPPPDLKTSQPWVDLPESEANSEDSDLQEFFKGWVIAQMMSLGISPELSLAYSTREKITWFLHTHFTTIQSKVNSSRSLYFQNQLFRLFAFDGFNPEPKINFKDLTVKVSIDNAMLRLLDGDLNVKGNPNENYGRELLELYSIGRGLEGSVTESPTGPGDYILYTEQDVQAAARVLSGWQVDDDFQTIDADTLIKRGKVRGSALNASGHDNESKQFSARFNNAIISPDPLLMNGGNATEASAMDEIQQLINLLYSKEETAKHICWKLYRFFVYAPHSPEESLEIDETVISEMAATFISNGYKIQPVLENLFRSEHFYEGIAGDVKDDNFGGIIKSPVDLVVGTYKLFNIQLPDITAITTFYEKTAQIIQTIDQLGLRFYEPYDVAGYEAYHQFPIYHRSWITPNYLARRYDFTRSVIMHMPGDTLTANMYTFVKDNFEDAIASDARLLITSLAEFIFPVSDNLTFDEVNDDNATITVVRLTYFKQRFLQQFDEDYWTTRWGLNADDLDAQLEFLFNAMMQSPEYQLS